MPRAEIDTEIETLRELVIAATKSADVGPDAEASLERLNALHQKSPEAFTAEDVRFINMLRGKLGARLDAHQEGGPYAPIAKPKGVKLDHCWRCQTPLDERFTETCPECSTKAVKALVCPVCKACGCQAAGKVMV